MLIYKKLNLDILYFKIRISTKQNKILLDYKY